MIIAGGAALAEASVGDFVAPTLGLGAAAAALSAAAAAGGTLAYLAALQCPKSRPCRVRQIMIKRERGIDFFSGPLSPKSSAEGLLRVDWYSSREDKVSKYLSAVDKNHHKLAIYQTLPFCSFFQKVPFDMDFI